MSSRLPDFLVIGAPKGGTTSLYRYLATHPDVFMSPVKEPHYFISPERRPAYRGVAGNRFNSRVVWRFEEYQRLFDGRGGQRVAGEASPTYLYAEGAPEAIRERLPDVRMITILRQPADRAYSHFCHNRRIRREPLDDFEAALEAEEQRIAEGWAPMVHYRARGRYAEQLARYLAVFPSDRILILFQDDLKRNAAGVLAQVCRFLGIDDGFEFATGVRHNVTSGMPRYPLVHQLFSSESGAVSLARRVLPEPFRRAMFEMLYLRNLEPIEPLRPALRSALTAEFHDDIRALERMTGRDLSAWL